MEDIKKIGNIKDKVSKRTISDLVHELKTEIIVSDKTKIFFMGYCASNKEMYNKIIHYIMNQININPESVYEIHIPKKYMDVRYELSKLADNFSKNNDRLILVKSRGFEEFIRDFPEPNLYRAGHDYDQNVIEHPFTDIPENKKVLIITHIGESCGKEIYEEAVRSALKSEFRTFFYEV